MTTATKPKTDALADLRAAEEQLEAAREERARLGTEAQEWATARARAEDALGEIAAHDPAQFDAQGQPRPKSEAAKLRAKLEESAQSKWPQILDGADARIVALESEVRGLVERHAVELARREFRAGEEELGELDALAEQMLALINRIYAHRDALFRITSSVRGNIDGRDVASDESLVELARILEHHHDFTPPRIAALTPLTDEEPRKVLTADGTWNFVGRAEPHPEQPEPLEPAR